VHIESMYIAGNPLVTTMFELYVLYFRIPISFHSIQTSAYKFTTSNTIISNLTMASTGQGIGGAQNEHGQGLSHATDPNASKVPHSVQEKVPKGLEDSLPDKVHPTEGDAGRDVSHATGKSIVPQKLQEKLPEKVERVVPNAIHDTSDKSGL